ncbi:MAG: fatty acid desaturase [Alphaproteobacteria bacterium]|nr:fatty acid desaturase [Alphaproteobacteria bacterium]MCB9796605.1 fatty acid desaturase [Alphaproteobacteria bacterium]
MTSARELARRCAAFRDAHDGVAAVQFLSNLTFLLVAYLGLIGAISVGTWWALPPLLLVAVVMVLRLFSIQHDCGHGAFVSSKRGNTWIGRVVSLFTLTPYGFWRVAHNRHHATTGDLERGGVGDVFTCSVAQYLDMPEPERRSYRRFRDPRWLILLGAPLQFIIRYRLPWVLPMPAREVWRSVLGLDLGLTLLYGGAAWWLGPGPVAAAALAVLVPSTWLGGWFFFMQHQFERTAWRRHEDWDFYEASMACSSYYDLPEWLHWCTGHVGIHHVHHLCAAVPNYRLQECLAAMPELHDVNRITLRESLGCAHLALWDEGSQRLLSFAEARGMGLIP